MNPQGVHDVRAVNRDRVRAQFEHRRDLFIRFAVNNHLQYFQLPLRERRAALSFQHRTLLDCRIENRFSCSYLADRGPKFEVHRVLEDVSSGAGLDRLPHPCALRMHAQHENRSVRRIFNNLSRSLQTVHAGQSAIHHHHLRMKFFRELDGLLAVACFADDFHVGLILEHAAETAPHQAVIIHQQYCDLLFHKTLFSPWERPDAPEFHLARDAKK